MSGIEAEVYALSDLNTQLRKLSEQLESAIENAQKSLEQERARLANIEEERRQEVARCQAAYSNCRSHRDEDGYSPPCTAELVALNAAERKLEEIGQHVAEFTAQADRLGSRMAQASQSIKDTVASSRDYLERHIQELVLYLRSNPEEYTHRDHADPLYQSARREWFRRGATGELENEARHLEGWMRQEVNAGGYYSSPNSYQTGHFAAGLHIPENFRWQLAEDNMLHGRIAPRYGLPHSYW